MRYGEAFERESKDWALEKVLTLIEMAHTDSMMYPKENHWFNEHNVATAPRGCVYCEWYVTALMLVAKRNEYKR
jgi:hypothetical protein